MGFFDFLKKSAEPAAPAAPAFPVTLAADAKGTVVAMENTLPRAKFTPPRTVRSPRPPTAATRWAS